MSQDDDKDFDKVVSSYLREGLHTRRGLTREEYIALCRKAWNTCHATTAFPFKVLIDPLRPTENMFANSAQEYVHWRAADSLEALREPGTAIRCTTVGAVNPDLSTGHTHDNPPLAEEPDIPETRRYIVAVFDVLGFSALLRAKGLDEITALYSKLITEAVTKEAMRTYNIIRLSDTEMGSIFGVLPVRHAHFSDTILLWAPLVQHFIAPFLARCADMVCEALRMGLPLRGAVAAGSAVLHPGTGTFIGSPLVEAAKLEQAQDWLGVSLGLSMTALDVSREFDPTLVVPYQVPLKRGMIPVTSDLALDWPSRFRSSYGTSPIENIQGLDTSPAHRIYYENAKKFAEFSGGPVLRSEGFHPPHLSELAEAALNARTAHSPLDRSHQLRLKDLTRTGAAGASVAAFLRSVAAGDDVPPVPGDLPSGMQRYLRELSLAVGGSAKYFKLADSVIEALRMRFCAIPLGDDVTAGLQELEKFGRRGQSVARFLRELAAGGEPVVPRGLSLGMQPFLKQALAWAARGEVPSGVLQQVANACLEARSRDADLDEDARRTLAVVDATGGTWPQVVAFLRGTAAGDTPAVPEDVSPAVHGMLVRIRHVSTLAGVQQPRTLEIISVGLGDPPTGIDLFSLAQAIKKLRGRVTALPEKIEDALRTFEAGAEERTVVAQRLRALATSAPLPPEPERLPVAIKLVLIQLQAAIDGASIPLDPSLVGLAAIRSRHGGGDMGDCILFSLRAMMMANEDSRTLANYLWRVAKGGPAIPVPSLTEPHMKETVEEVRCLADRQVGGIRMMMSPAGSSSRASTLNSP